MDPPPPLPQQGQPPPPVPNADPLPQPDPERPICAPLQLTIDVSMANPSYGTFPRRVVAGGAAPVRLPALMV